MEQYINKIINADCLDILKQLPDKCIDLVLTDPPYGIGIDGQKQQFCNNKKHNRKEHKQKDWDSVIPQKEVFDEIKRIAKNMIVWGGNYFNEYLDFILCALRLCRHKEYYNDDWSSDCGQVTRYECPRCLKIYVRKQGKSHL